MYNLRCLTESLEIRSQDLYTFKTHWTVVRPVWCGARPRMGTKLRVVYNVHYCVLAALRSHMRLLIPKIKAFIASCPSASPASSSVEILPSWRVLASLSYCRIISSAQCTRQSSNFLAMTLTFVQNSASVAD